MTLKPGGPLRRGKGLKRGKPLRKMSDKKRAEIPEHDRIRAAVFKRDGFKCRIAPFLPDMKCVGPLTVHHLLKASQGGKYDEDNLITACAGMNDWVEDHPEVATIFGLVRRPRPGGASGEGA